MERLTHYFTPFQCFVMGEAENDRQRFDLRVGLEILAREAAYRAEGATRQGLFLYQLEVLSRNRMGYDAGLDAVAHDPAYDEAWRNWILTVRRQIGIVDLADLIFVRSEFYHERRAAEQGGRAEDAATHRREATAQGFAPLFGRQEGRIAWANRGKDPLLLFAALHRQLGYPEAPKPQPEDPEERLLPSLARRVEQLESRLKLVEEEQRGGINLERFYAENQKKLEGRQAEKRRESPSCGAGSVSDAAGARHCSELRRGRSSPGSTTTPARAGFAAKIGPVLRFNRAPFDGKVSVDATT